MLVTLSPPVTRLAAQLKQLRDTASLSCRELARLAGLTPGHVSQIERESPRIEAVTLASIAGVFGVSLDWLYHGRGERPSDTDITTAVRRAMSRADRAESSPAKKVAKKTVARVGTAHSGQ